RARDLQRRGNNQASSVLTLQSRGHLSADRTPALEGREAALRKEIDVGETQAILYTSGTTGRPKGALITFRMQWWSAVGSALHLGLQPDDRWLACLPFYHIGGLSMLLKNVIYGVPVLVFERFDAAAVNAAIIDEQV